MQETALQNSLIPILDPILLDFENRMRKVIREEFQMKISEDRKEKLSSPEVTRHLWDPAISLPTLAKYTHKGWLKKYYIGGRTYYKEGEVLEAMKTIQKYQR